MQGTILSVSFQENIGAISGDDGNRYNFDAGQWCTTAVPAIGQRVDFVPSPDGKTATEIYISADPIATAPYSQVKSKDKIVAALLAFFLGSFGIHKFYLGYTTAGIIMLSLYLTGIVFAFVFIGFVWIWIPGLIAFIETIIYLTRSDEDFYQTYVVGKKEWF